MRYLLDTTVLIDHVRGKPTAVALVRELFSEPNDLLTCDATIAEAVSKVYQTPKDILAELDALLAPK